MRINHMTSKQRAYLKSLAMTIEPIFQLGKASLTPENTKAISEALEARELIKINVLQNCADNPKEIAVIIAERTHSQIVQVIGKKIVLYKPKVKVKKKPKDNTKTSNNNIKSSKKMTQHYSKQSAKNKLKNKKGQQPKEHFKNKMHKDTQEGFKKEFKNKAKNTASKNSRSMEFNNGSRKKNSRNYGGNI